MLLIGAVQIEKIASPFPLYALLRSVKCVQLRLITILRNIGCFAVASVLSPSITYGCDL
jgi:hypothetical protein